MCIIIAIVLSSQAEKKEVEVENPMVTAGVCNVPLEALNSPIETSISVEGTDVEVVAEEEPVWVEMDVPSGNSFKSYMDYRKVTDKTSPQYSFLQACEDSACGIMLSDGRYCIALGSYYATEIGTRVDLVMENSSIVPCVVADCKNNDHTDASNQQHLVDKSVVEFVVNTDNLSDYVRYTRGDCSYADSRLEGEISAIRVYVEN